MKSSLFIRIELKNNELLSSISIWSWSNLMWCMHGTNKLSILDKGLSMGNTQRFQGPLFLDLKSTHYRNVMPWRKHDFAWGIQEILYTVYTLTSSICHWTCTRLTPYTLTFPCNPCTFFCGCMACTFPPRTSSPTRISSASAVSTRHAGSRGRRGPKCFLDLFGRIQNESNTMDFNWRFCSLLLPRQHPGTQALPEPLPPWSVGPPCGFVDVHAQAFSPKSIITTPSTNRVSIVNTVNAETTGKPPPGNAFAITAICVAPDRFVFVAGPTTIIELSNLCPCHILPLFWIACK